MDAPLASLGQARQWRLTLVVAALAASTLAVIAFADPFSGSSWLPPCPFHALTGLYCPGCGTTRALHALLHGNLLLAWSMNPLAVVAVPFLPLMWRPQWVGRLRLPAVLVDARPWLVVVLTFALLRNLPWAPFSWLAPG